MIEIKNLEGHHIINPVVITDGLSDASLVALRSDIEKTYEFKTSLKLPIAKSV